ncbi:MAG: hypothetical protein AAF211_11755, partial [Myxococcota bacterium]
VALNVVGSRLYGAGIQEQPNIILRSLPGLDVVWRWEAFESERFVGGIKLQGSNLLNPVWRWTQQYTAPDDAEIAPGQTFDPVVWRQFRRGWELGAQLTFGIR